MLQYMLSRGKGNSVTHTIFKVSEETLVIVTCAFCCFILTTVSCNYCYTLARLLQERWWNLQKVYNNPNKIRVSM